MSNHSKLYNTNNNFFFFSKKGCTNSQPPTTPTKAAAPEEKKEKQVNEVDMNEQVVPTEPFPGEEDSNATPKLVF